VKKYIYIILIVTTVVINAKIYVPDQFSVQYAGNTGFVSIGGGYNFFNKKIATSFSYGYLPKSLGGVNIRTFSFKNSYTPWQININENYIFKPLTIGITIIYTFGENFFIKRPSRYPDDYYRQTAIRLAPFVGSSFLHKTKGYTDSINFIEFYTELGTIDYYLRDYLYSALDEQYLTLNDIVNFSFGFRIYF